ncbi:MAG: peptide deformylase [Colwelliaceae bacterium]|jgi:peptide deformylase|nr:peptide deformylase [Colwelliaceae bacterium]
MTLKINEKSKSTKKIAQLGHPVLRLAAEPVDNIHDDETQNIIKEMMDCVTEAGGVGIAAPQMYINKRIFIMCSKPNERYPDAPLMKPKAIINPEIVTKSRDMFSDWEGCLSVPSMRGLVPRHQKIKVKYFDQYGRDHVEELQGFIARIFQHELDHLNGLTFIDRVVTTRDLISESEWYQQFLK